MKKYLSVILALLMCLALVACGQQEITPETKEKSKAVKSVEKSIEEIGTVELSSEENIIRAEKLYAELSDSDKKEVENAKKLKEAREKINSIYISNAENAISEIGTVSESSVDAILNARKAYDAVPSFVKKSVKNYDQLQSAESLYRETYIKPVENAINLIDSKVGYSSGYDISQARSAYDSLSETAKGLVCNYALLTKAENDFLMLDVNYVIALIDKIGTVNYGSKSAIESARNAMDLLDEEERGLVTNNETLLAAEDSYNALIYGIDPEDIYSRLHPEYSNGVTWYESNSMPQFIDLESYVLPYIGDNGSSVWLRLVFDYYGDVSIGYTTISIITDGEIYKKDIDTDNKIANSKNGKYWEFIDVSPDEADIDMLWKIVYSESAQVCFEGVSGDHIITLDENDKNAIQDVLLYYEYLS